MVKISNLNQTFYTKDGELEVLKNINFNLMEGQILTILGPSGSGKSTILNILTKLLKPTSGDVIINGKIGYMFQKDNLLEWRNIMDNITIGLEIQKKKTDEAMERVERLLKTYGLWDFRNMYPKELSGGMRQRVALIRTLSVDPDILLLDEPFSALDYQTRLMVNDDVYKIIKNENKSVILVTHDNMIASYAKKFLYLRDGQIINRIDCQNGSQVDFFNEIVKITTQDSLLKLFNPQNNLKKESKKEFQEKEIKNSVGEKTEDRKNENTTSQVKVETFEPKKSTTARLIVYAIFDGLEYDEASALRNRVLNFDKDAVRFNNTNYEEIEIPYGEIKSTKISMCSRSIISWPMPEFRFYLDLDIITKDNNICRFEVLNQRNALSLFDTLEKHQIVMEDPYGIVTLYRSKPDDLVRHRYLLYNFKKIAKEYNLDNPRNL